MGGEISAEEKNNFASMVFSTAQKNGLIPDIGMDKSLLMFSGLNSTAVLEEYTSNTLNSLEQRVPGYILSLGSSLAAFAAVPNAVGLGALVISFLIDFIISSVATVNSDSTLNIIRRVFAEEKASDIRDSMDEYIKRLGMFISEPERALEETKWLEKQLSKELTRLRNSMLHDDQMSSRAMKYWANGAAFHVQMLAHETRLKMAEKGSGQNKDLDVSVASISRVADHYQKDLQELLKKYRSYKGSTLSLHQTSHNCIFSLTGGRCSYKCMLDDSKFRKHVDVYYDNCKISSEEFIDYMFNNWSQIKELNEYFPVFKRDLRELIMQHQTFYLKIKS